MPESPAPTIRTSKCSPDGLPNICARHPAMTGRLSVAVVIGLERALGLHTDIVGLVLPKLCQLHADLGEMQSRHLLVQRLRQHVDLLFVFAVLVIGEKLDLR